MELPECKIVLLATDGPITRVVGHALRKRFTDVVVILEQPVSRLQLLRRRASRLGLFPVVGQALFVALTMPVLRRQGRHRIEQVKQQFNLDDSPLTGDVFHIPSVNSDDARQLLRALDPGVVLVNGTRIIGQLTLAAVSAPFVNMHAGITPLYRGVHGAYWALAEGRPDLAGTTIHRVDIGIDTGTVLERVTFSIAPEDNLATYPFLHTAAGLPVLLQWVEAHLAGRSPEPKEAAPNLPSRLRYHPTVWGYWGRRMLGRAR